MTSIFVDGFVSDHNDITVWVEQFEEGARAKVVKPTKCKRFAIYPAVVVDVKHSAKDSVVRKHTVCDSSVIYADFKTSDSYVSVELSVDLDGVDIVDQIDYNGCRYC